MRVTRDVWMSCIDLPRIGEHSFEVVLFLYPTVRIDSVTIRADENVVVITHAPFAEERSEKDQAAAQMNNELNRLQHSGRLTASPPSEVSL